MMHFGKLDNRVNATRIYYEPALKTSNISSYQAI